MALWNTAAIVDDALQRLPLPALPLQFLRLVCEFLRLVCDRPQERLQNGIRGLREGRFRCNTCDALNGPVKYLQFRSCHANESTHNSENKGMTRVTQNQSTDKNPPEPSPYSTADGNLYDGSYRRTCFWLSQASFSA